MTGHQIAVTNYKKFEGILTAKRDCIQNDISERLARVSETANQIREASELNERASLDLGRDFDAEWINQKRTQLIKVFDALDRIRKGKFGKCRACGDRIAEQRLEALPETDLCKDCVKEPA